LLWLVYSGCYGYFTYPLSTDPWNNIPIPSNKPIDNGIGVTPSIAENNRRSTPLNSIQSPVAVQPNLPDSLLIGVGLRNQGRHKDAKDFFLSYLNTHPDNQAAYVYLYSCADSITTPAIIQYFSNLPKQAANEHKLLLAHLYLMQGDVSSAKKVNNAIIAANPNTALAVRARLNNLSIALYFDHDALSASAILSQVEAQASLSTPNELSTAEAELNYYVDPGTGEMPSIGATQSSSSTDSVQAVSSGSLQNYPNPFNPTTTISYQVPKDGRVTIKIFDIIGREVTTLVDEFKPSGRYSVKFDASRLSSGIYFYSIRSGDYNAVKKMSLIK
jgi:Secretion system C-terminal sorting domain